MPINLPNFLGANTASYGPGDLLQGAIEGYQASRMPKQLAQEERQRDLAARLSSLQGNELQQKIENPAMYSSVPEAVLLGLSEHYKGNQGQQGQDGELSEKYKNLAESLIKKRRLDIQRKEQIVNSNQWDLMTVDQKANVAAIANSMGIPQETLAQGISEAKSLNQIARENGRSDEEIADAIENPKNLPTRATQTAAQTRGTFAEEREVMSDFINKAFTKFPNTIFGYSPKMAALQLSGESVEDQSDYWAARALGPENAGITAKMVGLPGGIQMLRSIQDKALTETKAFKSLISPEVYAATQRKINHVTKDAFAAGQKYALSPGKPSKSVMDKAKDYGASIENAINSGSITEDDINDKRANQLGSNLLSQAGQQRQREEQAGQPQISAALNNQGKAGSLQLRPEMFTKENIEHTAKMKNMTPQEVAELVGVPYAG